MAGVRTKINDVPRTGLMEFVCDKIEEVEDAPTTIKMGTGVFIDCKYYAPMGSTLIVGNENGDTLIYILFSFGWKQI